MAKKPTGIVKTGPKARKVPARSAIPTQVSPAPAPCIPYYINICKSGYKYPTLISINGIAGSIALVGEAVKAALLEHLLYGSDVDDDAEADDKPPPTFYELMDRKCDESGMPENRYLDYSAFVDGAWVANPAGTDADLFATIPRPIAE